MTVLRARDDLHMGTEHEAMGAHLNPNSTRSQTELYRSWRTALPPSDLLGGRISFNCQTCCRGQIRSAPFIRVSACPSDPAPMKAFRVVACEVGSDREHDRGTPPSMNRVAEVTIRR